LLIFFILLPLTSTTVASLLINHVKELYPLYFQALTSEFRGLSLVIKFLFGK